VVGPGGPDVSDCAALEFTVHDRPGLLSSITSVLVDNGCHVASGQAWTHNGRAAGVLYVTATADGAGATALLHPSRWARIERLVNAVVDARENVTGERHWVCMSEPVHGRVHTERRLHQLMHDDKDYESGPAPTPVDEGLFSMGEKAATARTARRTETRVSIESWEERGYAVVKMTSRDRPRLLFDTVCALTDMHYVVFHATVGSQGPLAIQVWRKLSVHVIIGHVTSSFGVWSRHCLPWHHGRRNTTSGTRTGARSTATPSGRRSPGASSPRWSGGPLMSGSTTIPIRRHTSQPAVH
jgi:UTP:GlnB (protein PII) uridylyltransferase